MAINLKKLDRMELLAFQNGLRLHRDAILLYKEKRYPSAFYLSVLSQMDWSPSFVKLMQEVADGKLEQDKQSAVYVGLKRDNKRKIDINGWIRHPFKVIEEKDEKQITKINDSLVDLCMGVINDYYIVDNENIEKMTSKKLLAELERNWKKKSSKALARIKSIEKQLNKLKASK